MDAQKNNNFQYANKINEFFDQYTLPASQELLSQLIDTSANDNFYKLPADQKERLIVFQKRLSGLLEGVYELNTIIREDQP